LFNLQRRAMIQNLSNLTKKVALEVPYNARWCVKINNWNYMDLQCYGIFLQIWKEEWRKHSIQYLTKLAYTCIINHKMLWTEIGEIRDIITVIW
jgi:hypothetical protein